MAGWRVVVLVLGCCVWRTATECLGLAAIDTYIKCGVPTTGGEPDKEKTCTDSCKNASAKCPELNIQTHRDKYRCGLPCTGSQAITAYVTCGIPTTGGTPDWSKVCTAECQVHATECPELGIQKHIDDHHCKVKPGWMCASSSAWNANAEPKPGQGKCAYLAGELGEFQGSSQACATAVDFGDTYTGKGTKVKRKRSHLLAAWSDACCGATDDICSTTAPQMCTNKSTWQFNADAGVGGASCRLAASMIGNIVPNGQTCNEEITFNASRRIRGALLQNISVNCCSGTKGICGDFFNGSNTTITTTIYESSDKNGTTKAKTTTKKATPKPKPKPKPSPRTTRKPGAVSKTTTMDPSMVEALTGTIDMEVDPHSGYRDAGFLKGVSAGIADAMKVKEEYVTVVASSLRRLDAKEYDSRQPGIRRLAKGKMRVDLTAKLPSDSTVRGTKAQGNYHSLGVLSLQARIKTQVTKLGLGYSISVLKKSSLKLNLVPLNPDNTVNGVECSRMPSVVSLAVGLTALLRNVFFF